MTICYLDIETRSDVNLRARPAPGSHRYFESQHADILCFAYAFDDGPVRSWRRGQPFPAEVAQHINAGGMLSGWNSSGFERIAFATLGPAYGWPVPRIEQWLDTMHRAAAMALPTALGKCAEALGLPEQKDKDGERLIRKFSIPRKPRLRDSTPGGIYWNEPEDHPEDFEAFVRYCEQDVRTERALAARLVPLSEDEQEIAWLTDRMNERGVLLDLPLVNAMKRIVETSVMLLDRRMRDVTRGAVDAVTKVADLKAFLQRHGVEADSLAKAAIEDLLSEDLPPVCREAVEIRKEAAKSSTAKIDAMLACVRKNGRASNQVQYHGAATGRWSGRLIQLQNLPRGTGTIDDPERAAPVMLSGDARAVSLFYGKPMSAVSDMLRSCIIASPGCRLVVADYSSIEGRVTAWLAGEAWKVEAFRLNDAGLGPGMYELTAAGIFNCAVAEITKKDPRRQVGKVAELALGFQGGVMAFDAMAKVYGLNMAVAYEPLLLSVDGEVWEKAESWYEKCLSANKYGAGLLTREQWLASEVTKRAWRAKHPATVALWGALEDAARAAVEDPGAIVSAGRIKYLVSGGYLWCQLPSGRCLCYAAPRVEPRYKVALLDGSFETMTASEAEKAVGLGLGEVKGDAVGAVTALGVEGGRLVRFALYGGLATENCLSGSSEVLTDVGWRSIQTVESFHLVWDGQEWVSHGGVVGRGAQMTREYAGLRMTPDHEVWTSRGWVHAENADLSDATPQGAEAYRAAVRSAARLGLRGLDGGEVALAHAMRLRSRADARRGGTDKGPDAKLRLPPTRSAGPTEDTRHVPAHGVRRLVEYVGALYQSEAPSLSQLRRPGDFGRRFLARLRGFLARHGRLVPKRADAREDRQLSGVLQAELRVGDARRAGAKHAQELGRRNALRPDAALRGGGVIWGRENDAIVPSARRLACQSDVRRAECDEPGLIEPVFDILNAGPRQRFLARGPGGAPLLVHNCVQAIARDVMARGMLNAERAGYPLTMTIHDEAVADTPLGFGSVDEFEALLCRLDPWAEGLPITAAGWEGPRYKKD